MPLRVLLIAVCFSACTAQCTSTCNSQSRPPPPRAAPMPRHPAAGSAVSADAGVARADAPAPTEFALFDHMPIRPVKTVTPAPELTPDPAPADHARLVAKATTRPVDFIAAVDIPPWCQRTINRNPVTEFHLLADGSSIAVAATQVALIDAHHRAELGLDFVGLGRGDDSEAGTIAIVDAARSGDIVVAVIQTGDDATQQALVAVDAQTGGIAWRTAVGSVFKHVAVAHGYAIAATGGRLVAYRLDTGRAAASTVVHDGWYSLGVAADGAILAADDDGDQRLEVTVP